MFGSRVFPQIRPVWVGDLGTRPKNQNLDGLSYWPFGPFLPCRRDRQKIFGRFRIEVFGLVPNTPIHTGLICVKISATNFSCLGPINRLSREVVFCLNQTYLGLQERF